MVEISITRSKELLGQFEFQRLFIEELGWSRPAMKERERFDIQRVTLEGRWISEMSGVPAMEVVSASDFPNAAVRTELHREINKRYHENLLIFVDAQRTKSVWRWNNRENGRDDFKEHTYVKGQTGDLFLGKLSAIRVTSDQLQSGGPSLAYVMQSLRNAFNVEKVTKKFYNEFADMRLEFMELIRNISDPKDRKWYASILLNRLMFIYFLQRKLFLNRRDARYLQNKLEESKRLFGDNSYYCKFLVPLFFEGFAKPPSARGDAVRELLGDIVYLNGGLFLMHRIEEEYPNIQIPDQAFENLFRLFESYSWNLDDTPGGKDDEINPDVLGYIFEKYINQKEFGAYYTRPEITEYLCEQTIHKFILKQVNESFGSPFATQRKHYDNLSDLLLNLDAPLCRRLYKEILPKISILDPACGSGAFLVAAMKTLINVYSAVTGKIEFLSDTDLKEELKLVRGRHKSLNYHIKRMIITHNLFGVDVMEEACEIAKLRLFLALVASADSPEALEPLPNIDFNILPGNSLIGYLHVEPDDFDRHAHLLREPYGELIRKKDIAVNAYREAGNYSPELKSKREEIEKLEAEAAESLNEMLMDDFSKMKIQFEQATWDDRKGAEGKPKKRAVTTKDIATLHPFHWGYEFNETFSNKGGFDIIITNPPWETFKPQAKEFFEVYSDIVSKNKMLIKEFEKEQARLLKNPEIRSAMMEYYSRFPHVSAYFRSAPEYANQISMVNGKKAGTDINLYKLFTERCYRLLRNDGLCGIVIPSGIYTDLGTKQLREMLFTQCRVTGLFCFENSKGIFEGVHRSFKFVTLTFEKGGCTESFPTAFMRHDVEELAEFPRHGALPIAVETIRRLSPDSLSVTEFRDPLDFRIAEKMIRFPRLGEEVPGKWRLVLGNEFHMTNDSHLFRTEPGPGRLPLYEGKMIHQFTHTWGQPKYWVDEAEGRAALLGRTPDTGQKLDYQRYRLAYRSVASSTNERTIIAGILPVNVFFGHSLNAMEDNANELEALYCMTCLNSFVVDYAIRQTVSANLTMFFLYQLPVPRLTKDDPQFAPLVERAARLVCTSPEFDDLAKAVGLRDHRDGVTDPNERARIRAEIDAIVAHLYGLTEEEFAHILSTFPLVAEEMKRAAMREFEK